MALLPCSHCALPPRPVEEFVDPWLPGSPQTFQRVDRYLLVDEHRDTAADGEQRGEIVGDDDDGDAEAPVQLRDQRVDATRDERIEVGGRLVEKQDSRIEREGARERRALDHSARKLGRKLDARVRLEPGELELHRRNPFLIFRWKLRMLAQRQHDVLGDRKRRKQCALLEQHADERSLFGLTDAKHRLSVEEHLATIRTMETGERLEQYRLARTRTAGDAEDLAALDIEVDAVVHFLAAEPVDDPARGENRLGMAAGRHRCTPTLAAPAAALPPEGEQFAPWDGPAAQMCTPTLAATASALPPEGEQFAPWDGPAALITQAYRKGRRTRRRARSRERCS